MKCWVFFYGVCALSSCKWEAFQQQKHAKTSDTLTYKYKKIDEKETNCAANPEGMCAEASIEYPVFQGQKVLNDTIFNRLLTLSFDEKHPKTLQQIAVNFIRSYQKDKKERPNIPAYNLEGKINVIRQDSSLITFEFGYACECGGAHGNYEHEFINWDTKKHKMILLDDIFINGYQKRLNIIGEKIFRKNEKLSDTASLANDYLFDDDKFVLNDNFSITPSGIRFFYNDYEIKPYAAGPTELVISYSQIKSLLRPRTVVAQYIK